VRSKTGFNARLCHLATQTLGPRRWRLETEGGRLARACTVPRTRQGTPRAHGRPVQRVPWHADASETDGGYRFQPVDCLGTRSIIRRDFCCRVDKLRVLDVRFLLKVEAMQDSLAAANGPRCGPWLLRNS
jgi:hypothetical protein